MKKVLYVAMILIPILMLAFAAPALAGDKKEKPPKPAKLVAKPTAADFGKFTGNEAKEATVQISNSGGTEAKDVKCVATAATKGVTVSPEAITVGFGKDAKPVDLKLAITLPALVAEKDKKGKEKPIKDAKITGTIECKYEGGTLKIAVKGVQTPGAMVVKKEEPKKEEPKPADPVAPPAKAEDKKDAAPAAPAATEPKKEEPKKEEPKK